MEIVMPCWSSVCLCLCYWSDLTELPNLRNAIPSKSTLNSTDCTTSQHICSPCFTAPRSSTTCTDLMCFTHMLLRISRDLLSECLSKKKFYTEMTKYPRVRGCNRKSTPFETSKTSVLVVKSDQWENHDLGLWTSFRQLHLLVEMV